jgi:beta-N-acetylhexosaminidase
MNPLSSPTASRPAPSVDLDTKIGQMVLLGLRGLWLTPDNPIVADVRDRRIGGVVLFQYDIALNSDARNIQSPAQLGELTAALQALAEMPLLVSVDQEGGMISRLTEQNGFPATRSEQHYGSLNQPSVTRAAAEAEGKVLRAAGINLNLAPVVDVNVNLNNPVIARYERSFSADPHVVTQNALAEIEGYHTQGVLCTLKHFPGHGSSTGDSHLGFVDVTGTWSDLELEPYRGIIQAGMADAVMTAHVFNAKLDPQYPATLSGKIINGILRGQLGYDGVVISDDLQMGAIRQYYGLEQAVELAVNAGVDVLAFANNSVYEPDAGIRAIAAIRKLVQEGKLAPERIEQSYQRLVRLKARIA